MRLAGWRFEGAFPDLAKFVVIVAPHTSNWDFVIGVIAMFAVGIRLTFLGKHTLFRWPLGAVMRWLGGVPVDRHSPHNVVDQTIARFASQDAMVLALSPEGTRKKLPEWRTGFHYVARGAGVPIVPVALDYRTRAIRIFSVHHPGVDADTDRHVLGALFDAGMAFHPSRY